MVDETFGTIVLTFMITSLVWGLIWAIATIDRLKNKK